jgi:hypothetical protein
MSDIKVDVVFGFMTQIELDKEDKVALDAVDLVASPLLYTTEDKTNRYIVGKEIMSLGSAGQYRTLSFNLSEEEKSALKKEVLEKLNQAGFDVPDKPFDLYVNTYYW